jgi:hypothetical protein
MSQDRNSISHRQVQGQNYDSNVHHIANENQLPPQSSPKNVIALSTSAIKSSKLVELLTMFIYLAICISLMFFTLIAQCFFLIPVITLMMNDISYMFRKCVDSFFSENHESISDKNRK